MMKQRCYNKNHVGYKNYGGRGIVVCNEWKNNFKAFYNDMNKPMKKHIEKYGEKFTQLDRIKNNGNYSKSNCRWVTPKKQARNTRRNIIIDGISLPEFCEKNNIKNNNKIYYKIKTMGAENTLKYLTDEKYKTLFKAKKKNKIRNKQLTFFKRQYILNNTNCLKDFSLKTQNIIIERYGIKSGVLRSSTMVANHLGITVARVNQVDKMFFEKV